MFTVRYELNLSNKIQTDLSVLRCVTF
jgi:hypothetical protein